MESYWWGAALACSLVDAAYVYMNQVLKMPGLLIMLYRGFLVSLLMLPLVLITTPIKNEMFYVFCVIQGATIAFNDYRFFRASKAFGAEVSSIIHPLSISVMFLMWLLITPAQVQEFIREPLRFAAISACLGGIIFAIIKLRHAKASHKAFLYLLPCLFTLAVGDIFNKKSMYYGAEDLSSAIIYYSFITGIVCGLCNLFFFVKKKQNFAAVVQKSNLYKGLIVSLTVIILMVFKNLSMYLTPNPAYASAIILLYPLWIMLGNNMYLHFSGRHTNYARVDFRLVIGLLVAIIGLVLLNS